MTPTPQAIENAARAMRDITFDALTMDECRDAAQAALSADLGDMVLVPKEALAWLFGEGPDADGHWFEPPEIKEGELKKPYWWRSRFRAMLSAAQGDADDQG